VNLPLLIQGLGSIGVFSSRAFLPAFATALLLRFGPQIPWLAHAGLLTHVRGGPTWLTSDIALVVLGLLAALELVAERVPEAKAVLDDVHGFLKAGMAALTYLGVLNAADRAVLAPVVSRAGLLDTIPALLVGAGTLLASRIRGAVLGPLAEADEDDNLGLQGLIRRVEDLWGGLGPMALIVFPLLTLAAFGFAALILALVERRLEAPGDRTKVPCGHCGELIHASAPTCPHCHTPVKEPRDLGLLGQPKARPADLRSLPYRLVAVKRCPACATRFDRRALKQTCGACGHRLMDNPNFAKAYIGFIDRRVPAVCVACFLLGLIPVLGLIPGVITYRLAIVAPFRRYIPPGHGLVLRWAVRLVILVLVAFQWVPVAGGLAVPAIALMNYVAYRSVYRRLALEA
jgi:hypothetical protein